MTEKAGIHAIIHIDTQRSYVGSAGNISKRWHAHRKQLRRDLHRNIHLQAAWNCYGEPAFSFRVLEFTDELTSREQHWMDTLDSYHNGFNMCPIARSSRGRNVSEAEREMRRRILDSIRSQSIAPDVIRRRTAQRRTTRTLGEKLNWRQAQEIRSRYGAVTPNGRGRRQIANGGVTLQSLAEEYGVRPVTIYDVVRWKTWKSDPDESV